MPSNWQTVEQTVSVAEQLYMCNTPVLLSITESVSNNKNIVLQQGGRWAEREDTEIQEWNFYATGAQYLGHTTAITKGKHTFGTTQI